MKYIKKVKDFVVEAAKAAVTKVKNFFTDFYNHWETVGIMSLASIGLANLVGELPFWVTLPFWVESPLVVPVLAVLGIYGLAKLAEYRGKRRMQLA